MHYASFQASAAKQMRAAFFCVITQRVAVIYCRRFGTTYRSREDGPIGRPETSVRNYNYSLRNNTEERTSRLLRGGRLKSRTLRFIAQCIYVLRYDSYNIKSSYYFPTHQSPNVVNNESILRSLCDKKRDFKYGVH
jgi:3',5'-cyclic AMP phosphodiesterase CpdA